MATYIGAWFVAAFCVASCQAIDFFDSSDFTWRMPRAQGDLALSAGHYPGRRNQYASLFNRTSLLPLAGARQQADRRLAFTNQHQARCMNVPRNLTLCGTMGYDKMRVPNFLEQWNVNDIIAEAGVWNERLAEAHCNNAHSRLFLCSVLAPVCVENKAEPVPPCRNICQSVQNSCEKALHRRYGFTWPDVLSCDRFPSEAEKVCIGPDSLESISGSNEKTDVVASTDSLAPPKNAPVCQPCTPLSTVEDVMRKACSSQIAFRTKATRFHKRRTFFDIGIARRVRFVAQRPSLVPTEVGSIDLRDVLEKGVVRHVNVNMTGNCECPNIGSRRTRRGGMILMFANATTNPKQPSGSRTRLEQTKIRFEMTGFVQMGPKLDRNLKRFTQKLRKLPLDRLCSGDMSKITKYNGSRRNKESSRKKNSRGRNRKGHGRRRLSSPKRNHNRLLSYW